MTSIPRKALLNGFFLTFSFIHRTHRAQLPSNLPHSTSRYLHASPACTPHFCPTPLRSHCIPGEGCKRAEHCQSHEHHIQPCIPEPHSFSQERPEEASGGTHIPPHPAVQWAARKSHVLDSCAFLSLCESVADSSTSFFL